MTCFSSGGSCLLCLFIRKVIKLFVEITEAYQCQLPTNINQLSLKINACGF